MEVRTCDHLKEDGVYCNSPALKDRNYCYFHLNLRGRRLKMARSAGPNQSVNLPFPEDMHAVQVSLFEVLNGLANNRLDPKRAGLMLYALQQAATNLNHTPEWQGKCRRPKPNQPLLALEFPDFEERYHLPKDIDLEADPDAPPPATDSGPEESQTENPTTKSEKPRADRIPLPKPLWTMKDPDAPFRAYTSDGRELTRQDAARWRKRIWQQMSEFLENGGTKDWDDGIDEDVA